MPVQIGIRIGSFGISLGLIAAIVILAHASPLKVAGVFGTEDQVARVIAMLAPLVL